MDLGEAAVGREDQNAFGRLAERKRFFAVGRRYLGDHEIPGTDDLLLQTARRLRGGGAGRQAKREPDGGDDSRLHGNPPPNYALAHVIPERIAARCCSETGSECSQSNQSLATLV